MMIRKVICGDDVAVVWCGCSGWVGGGRAKSIMHVSGRPRVRGLRIIWNEMQSSMLICVLSRELCIQKVSRTIILLPMMINVLI